MWKRIALFAAAVIATAGLAVPMNILRQTRDEQCTVKFYVYGEVEAFFGANCVASGPDTIVTCSGTDAERVFSVLPYVAGVTVTMPGSGVTAAEMVQRFAVRVVRTEKVAGIELIYGYSPYVDAEPQVVCGENVNIQLAFSQNILNVGFPLLLTDY